MKTVKSDGLHGKMRRAGPVLWLSILFVLALLPALAMAAPSLSPPAPQDWGERGAAARQGPTVRIDPAELVVRAGQTFTVAVMIEEASDLGGFEFTLLFVTTTVRVDSVTVGDFPGSTGRTVIPVVSTIDNQAGVASFAVATVPPGTPGPNGTGVLATITLTVQGSGESPLDLQNVMVLDTNAQRQTLTIEDGVVQVGAAIYLPLILKDW